MGLVPREASAELVCQDLSWGRICSAGILSEVFHVNATPSNNRQIQTNWCWAACLEMVFRYHGHPVSQARIVLETYGQMVNRTIQPGHFMALLNRTWVDDNGASFRVEGSWQSSSLPNVATDLANDLPLIIGTHTHAMVSTGMTYSAPWVQTPWGVQLGNVQLQEVVVRDPWPGKPSRRRLSFQEVVQTIMMARVRVY